MEKTETKKLNIKEIIRKILEKFLLFLIGIVGSIFIILVIAFVYYSLI